jgi:hypothetical protein
VKNFICILFASAAAIAMSAGCASNPQQQGGLCQSCGEVVSVKESDTTMESLSNDGLFTTHHAATDAIASFDSLGKGGLATRQSSLTSPGPGMQLRRAEKRYDVIVRMNTGERRIIRLPRSVAGRWQAGDRVKVLGNSLIRK